MTTTDRRRFLRGLSLATAGLTIGPAGGTDHPPIEPASQEDPVLTFLSGWDEAIARLSAIPDDQADDYWTGSVAPFEHRAAEGSIPDATSAEGAAAAIRKALSFNDMEDQDANLVRSALAFLEGQSS